MHTRVYCVYMYYIVTHNRFIDTVLLFIHARMYKIIRLGSEVATPKYVN